MEFRNSASEWRVGITIVSDRGIARVAWLVDHFIASAYAAPRYVFGSLGICTSTGLPKQVFPLAISTVIMNVDIEKDRLRNALINR